VVASIEQLHPEPLGSNTGNAAALLSGVLASAMDAIITVDARQRIVLYNLAAERIFGWPAQEVLHQPLETLIPSRFRGEHAAHVDRFGQTGETARRMGDRTVVYGLRANGEEFPLDASISHLETPQGRLYTVILRDITERVRTQEERIAFAAQAQTLRENEKARVARELHDELAQTLTVLKMDTMWMRDNAGDASIPAKLDEMLLILDQAVASTRRIASDLRPLLLDDLGLIPAIEWLATNFTKRSGIACQLEVDESLELEEPYATAVFRVVQESLMNVAKHSGASKVVIGIVSDPACISLFVTDDGKGFDARAPRHPQSLGLMGLRERAQLLKGTVDIDSAAGRGASVRVSIPRGSM